MLVVLAGWFSQDIRVIIMMSTQTHRRFEVEMVTIMGFYAFTYVIRLNLALFGFIMVNLNSSEIHCNHCSCLMILCQFCGKKLPIFLNVKVIGIVALNVSKDTQESL